MPVSLCVIRVPRHPQHLGNTERVTEYLFRLVPGQPRVTVVVQDTLLSGEYCAVAIDVNPAAFHEYWRGKRTNPEELGDAMTDRCILSPACILFSPCVEMKQRCRDFARIIPDEVGARVPQP